MPGTDKDMASYISESSYKLKYRWTGYDNRGKAVQLDIYQKSSSSFTLTYIGGLKAINLRLQGGQGSVYSPIIKTSLEVTLVDAPDEVASGYKYGNWQEFYTPDSTKYLVKLYRCWEGSSQTLEWQGYITPDSWQESLAYRGAITIIARDNLGHLQDFEFDATPDKYGLVQIWNGSTGLLDLALSKISFPMDLAHNTSGDAKVLRDSDASALITSYVNAAKFKGKDWYGVVESVLESIGYCLRFVGGGFVLQPIRNLPLLGYTSRSTGYNAAQEVEFYGGDRANDPAYRELKEVVEFDAEDEISYDLHRNLTFGSSYTTYAGRQYKPRNQSWDTFTGRACRNTNSNGETQGGWLYGYGYGFLNPANCNIQSTLEAEDGAKAMELGIPLVADQTNDGSMIPTYRIACCSTDVTLTCEFARPVELKNASSPFTVARLKDYMALARLSIKYTDPLTSTVYYWNGSGWQTEYVLKEVAIAEAMAESYAFEIALGDISETATLGGWLDIGFANFLNYGEDAPDYGSFVRLTAIKTKLNAKSVLKSDTVTTINSTDYNVKIQRKPEIGAMSAAVPYINPGNYPGALWKYNSNGKPVPQGYAHYWSGYNSSTAIPLPAQIHKQILCFNHVSLQVVEGSMGMVTKSSPLSFGNLVLYKSHIFIIQSGSLDALHNRISSVVLHEYVWYDSLWNENNNPAYSGVPVFDTKSGSGNVNGTGSGSGSGGGGGGGGADGTVKSVGLSMPTGFNTSGSPITTSGTIRVSFANGYSLPTTAKQAQWDAAYGWGDHSQAGYGTVKSVGLTVPEGFVASNSPITGEGNIVLGYRAGYSLPETADVSKGVAAYQWGDHSQAGYGTLKSVGLSMPAGFSLSGSPITTQGTLQVGFESGYGLPKTEDVSKGVAAYGWGDHSQAGYGTVKSVGLTVPTGFSVSGSPVTTQGNLQIAFANGYSLPMTTDVEKGVTAYGWGDHSQEGYIKAVTYSMIVTALGFAPAEYADVNALQTRMDNAEEDIDALEAAIGGTNRGLLYAPKIRIYEGYDNAHPQLPFTPYMWVEHPLLDIANLNARCVLMVWSKRRGRIGATSTKNRPTYTGGWGEVRGKYATTAPLTWTKRVNLDAIRQFVLNNCLCGSYRLESAMRTMLLSSFNGYRKTDVLFGFKGKHAQLPTDFKAKESRLFGVAIRYQNPEWIKYAAENPAETTREIDGEEGKKIKRYIYSDVTPFRIHCNPDFNSYWRLGFQLNPFVGPVKL